MENWKEFKVKVSDYLNGDDTYTSDEYEAIFKMVCRECENDGKHHLVERDGYFFVEEIPEMTKEEKNAQTQARLTQAIQHHLDTKAQELNYDSCLSVCSYVDTGVEKFDAEGKAFRAWRSAVWNKGYEILNACLAGEREVPTEAELIAELPELNVDYS